MAGVSKNCITCSYVGLGSDLISQINIPGLPTLRQKRRPPTKQKDRDALPENIPEMSTNPEPEVVDLSKINSKHPPPFKKLDRPKYIFSKNNWTQEKEMALENLLMK